MTLEELLPEFKEEFKPYALQTLVGDGGDSVLLRCLDKAYLWLQAKLRPLGVTVNLEDEVLRQVLFKRAQYELYSYAENEEVARDKARDAVELLRAYAGMGIEGEEFKPKGAPVAEVVGGSTDWRGFAEDGEA